MATRLMYLEDFDVVTATAKVTGVDTTEDGRIDLQLDQTCFYPRGGGQDWDEGFIKSNDGSVIFAVNEVRLDENGVVRHIGTYEKGELREGDEVICEVNAERRETNTRLHSAGHILDMAIDQLGLQWAAGKGAHYPHMSFVEYEADITPEAAEVVRQQIEGKVHELVAAGSTNEIRFMPVGEMHTVCRHVPTNIPTNKPARVVMYAPDFGIPCGGTHVKDVHDIGQVSVTKVKSKKGITKVSYTVGGVN